MNINTTTKKQPRFGLIKARIGSRHVMKSKDGVNRIFEVGELQRHNGASVCVCLYCKKTYKNEDELVKTHPPTDVMINQQEAHVYCWWSDEPKEKGIDDPAKVVGLLSNEL